jgi:hypothetical protein
MLDIELQSRLAEATADMMRACARASARAVGLSAGQSLTVWLHMLQCAAGQEPGVPPAAAPAFASYRTASGHATAQVVADAGPMPAAMTRQPLSPARTRR